MTSRPVYRGRWRVDFTVRPGVDVPVARRILVDVMTAALDASGAPAPASIGLILSDDDELAALDAAHMGVEGPTDVLSFPLLPPSAFPTHPRAPTPAAREATARDEPAAIAFVLPPARRPHLGDVVVSVERAASQAGEGRGGQTGDVAWTVDDELRLLVVHGTLHVCGWDHADPIEEGAMRALERRLLGSARGTVAPQATPSPSSDGPKR